MVDCSPVKPEVPQQDDARKYQTTYAVCVILLAYL